MEYLSEEEENESTQKIPEGMTYFDDDGNEYNPNLHPLPDLCMSCKKRNDPNEETVCNLTRMDQMGEQEFKCFAYQQINNL